MKVSVHPAVAATPLRKAWRLLGQPTLAWQGRPRAWAPISWVGFIIGRNAAPRRFPQ
jgi:hypothetical protein